MHLSRHLLRQTPPVPSRHVLGLLAGVHPLLDAYRLEVGAPRRVVDGVGNLHGKFVIGHIEIIKQRFIKQRKNIKFRLIKEG